MARAETKPLCLCRLSCQGKCFFCFPSVNLKSLFFFSRIQQSNELYSNAEAGIGLICACLPATTALILHIRGGSHHNPSHHQNSRSYALSSISSPHKSKDRSLFQNLEAAAGSTDDGTTLVTHAQGFREEEEIGAPKGIYRRVEVRHEVSLAEELDEGRGEKGDVV
jgi:hypothetical protein